jgi:hypothetical protein
MTPSEYDLSIDDLLDADPAKQPNANPSKEHLWRHLLTPPKPGMGEMRVPHQEPIRSTCTEELPSASERFVPENDLPNAVKHHSSRYQTVLDVGPFGIVQSDVRKVLASQTARRWK